jgi:hypothetical protein
LSQTANFDGPPKKANLSMCATIQSAIPTLGGASPVEGSTTSIASPAKSTSRRQHGFAAVGF